ncbi:hypothetical protein E2C01_100738 [Portunus trituberculatus]|uniref:Uncharacterized protein n=1 Tax=Portunus trituberculatus TaxID=210409 RepID=A0A5B7KCZ6_PORTR|nr:hypothetical protein [Portunus trituberculatus]
MSVRCLPPSSPHRSSSCPPSSLFTGFSKGCPEFFSGDGPAKNSETNFLIFGWQAPQRGESSTCRVEEKKKRQIEGGCRQSWGFRFAALCCWY